MHTNETTSQPPIATGPTVADMLTVPRPCLTCAAPSFVRLDKNGRPFCLCAFCGTRIFMKSAAGLAGLGLTAELIDLNRDAFRSQLVLRMQVGSTVAQPAPAPSPSPSPSFAPYTTMSASQPERGALA